MRLYEYPQAPPSQTVRGRRADGTEVVGVLPMTVDPLSWGRSVGLVHMTDGEILAGMSAHRQIEDYDYCMTASEQLQDRRHARRLWEPATRLHDLETTRVHLVTLAGVEKSFDIRSDRGLNMRAVCRLVAKLGGFAFRLDGQTYSDRPLGTQLDTSAENNEPYELRPGDTLPTPDEVRRARQPARIEKQVLAVRMIDLNGAVGTKYVEVTHYEPPVLPRPVIDEATRFGAFALSIGGYVYSDRPLGKHLNTADKNDEPFTRRIGANLPTTAEVVEAKKGNAWRRARTAVIESDLVRHKARQAFDRAALDVAAAVAALTALGPE